MGKKILNTGQVSVPGSGDTIHNGGNKIYDNFDELYLAFGDQRLKAVLASTSEDWITPHATGYFQHFSLSNYVSAVAPGSMHDIESTKSAGFFPVRLPIIGTSNGNARRGEKVILQDSAGSWATVRVQVEPSSGQTISGADANGYFQLTESNTIATFTVVNEDTGNERWEVKIESIAGSDGAIISKTALVPSTGTTRLDLHIRENYNVIKVLVYVESRNRTTQLITKRSAFEIQVMNTSDSVISTKYGVLNTTENDNITECVPVMYLDSLNRSVVALDFTTTEPVTNDVNVTIKSISSLQQRV